MISIVISIVIDAQEAGQVFCDSCNLLFITTGFGPSKNENELEASDSPEKVASSNYFELELFFFDNMKEQLSPQPLDEDPRWSM